jgi:intracellular multiplication protein IcmK
MKRFCFRCLQGLILISLSCTFGGAYSQDEAQQALQQLRALQERLSKKPADEEKTKDSQDAQGNSNDQTSKGAAAVLPDSKTTTIITTNPPSPNAVIATAPHPDSEEIIKNKAFKDMVHTLYPLDPEQIVHLKQIYQTSEYAQASPAGTPPKPTATSQFVNLSPGSVPPVIRLLQGFVTSLVFLDATGAPWPIAAYDLGDPSAFNIQWDKTSNTLMIQAIKLYNYGNLAVRLRDLNTPVMITLIPGQKAVDYRVDLRIQGYGPNAKNLPMEEGLPPSANDLLLRVLDGVPPAGSQRLTISGGDARGWLFHEKMYIRTSLTILSPGWLASMTSADGTHAYEMQKSPVLLVSWHGKVMQLKVEGL